MNLIHEQTTVSVSYEISLLTPFWYALWCGNISCLVSIGPVSWLSWCMLVIKIIMDMVHAVLLIISTVH